jgi:hypothetical protein
MPRYKERHTYGARLYQRFEGYYDEKLYIVKVLKILIASEKDLEEAINVSYLQNWR